jgi:transposase
MEPVFKKYNQEQGILFPPYLVDLIPLNHPVHVVNSVIEKIDIDQIKSTYEGGGTSSYEPRMMLKVLVYAYMSNVYSSRKIEALLQENIYFMWLSGSQKPDHNTINRFRSEHLKDTLKQTFSKIVLLLHENGYLDIKDIYTDGTKMEANANRYTFVWGRGIKTRKEKILEQIETLWAYAEQVTKEELMDTRPVSYEEVTPEKIAAIVEQINEALKGKDIDKKVKQKLNRVKKTWPEQLERYEEQEKKMGGRNSYSKTDKDATFMRMKEDHMMNGQLKAGYNWQISTNNQMIVAYSIHQSASDTVTFKDHIEDYRQLYGATPEVVTADAGYGSEENYQYAEDNEIEAFIKYNYFHKEDGKKWKSDIHRSENLYYNADLDCFFCPMGQPMKRLKESQVKTKTGFTQTIVHYQAINCNGCPLRGACHKSQGNRIIEVNFNARRLKEKAKEKLTGEIGIKKRKRRSIEPETVFGNIKHNKNFKRFMLRGKSKVEIEVGLLAISHNLAKIAA